MTDGKRKDRHMDFDTLSSKTTGTKLDRTSERVMNDMIASSPAEFPDKSTWIRKASQFFVRAYLEVEQVTDLQQLLVDKVMKGSPPPMFLVPMIELDDNVKARLLKELDRLNALGNQRDMVRVPDLSMVEKPVSRGKHPSGEPIIGVRAIPKSDPKSIPKPGFKQTSRPPPKPPDDGAKEYSCTTCKKNYTKTTAKEHYDRGHSIFVGLEKVNWV